MINRFQRLKSPLSIGTLYGQNVGHPDIQRILDHLDRKGFPNLTAQDQRMYRLLAKAKSIAGPEGVNVAVLEGKTFKELLGLKEVHKEEFTHGWQRQLLGKDIPDWKLVDEHLDQSVAEDLHAKIPKGMKDYLSLHYSGVSMKLQVIEAGAKLISQHPEKFNMTIDQAADFLLAYTSAVADKYGNDAFKNLTTAVGVAREIKNIYATLGKEASVTIERVGSRSAPSP